MTVDDEILLQRLALYSDAHPSYDGWVSADLVQRGLRATPGLDVPSLTWVGRRLSALARDGRCEKTIHGGAGAYRASFPRLRFVDEDPMGLWLAGDEADDLGDETPGSPVRLLRLRRTGELVSLQTPILRGLVVPVDGGDRADFDPPPVGEL